MKILERVFVPLVLLGIVADLALAQAAGDFRSKQTGNWGTAGTWQ